MSSAIVYIEDDAAHLLTDGGRFADDGRMGGTTQKAIILADRHAVVTARGPGAFHSVLGVHLASVSGSFEDLVAAFPNACRQAHDSLMQAFSDGLELTRNPHDVDAVLVGYSQSLGFCSFLTASIPIDGAPAWSTSPMVREAGDAALQYVTPAAEDMEGRLRAKGVNLWDGEVDVSAHGLAVMRDQRDHQPQVGGFCQLTSVTRAGVSSRVLERWPVKPGTLPGLPAGRIAS